ncbi:MAG TPA: bifunctional precorrin-2 dehydrogenase/sirohydrochlorin ferrochelatase [Terriglobales bacterium]|nr:bifunctional precorrin-2 dehydrogenase/sirohydrochlorin ferrochelatase [Terriglobales bacterium]
MSSLFPMFLKLEGRRCLVVGAGNVAEGKIASLLETGARVQVVATQAVPMISEWAEAGQIDLHLRPFSSDDLDGVLVAVVATSLADLNERIYREAQQRGVLCNVVDVPQLCDFYYPAIVRRGDLQIAISTKGHSPALAKRLREQLEEQFGPAYAEWVADLGQTRKLVLASHLSPDRKRELLLSLASVAAVEAAIGAEPTFTEEPVA